MGNFVKVSVRGYIWFNKAVDTEGILETSQSWWPISGQYLNFVLPDYEAGMSTAQPGYPVLRSIFVCLWLQTAVTHPSPRDPSRLSVLSICHAAVNVTVGLQLYN